jgi:ABC-2 type transport system ATP-binding protein
MSEIRLQCVQLSKRYGRTQVLTNVNLTLKAGRIVGLLGPNGSGKTTLIKLANGLLQPDEGTISISGLPVGVDTKAMVSYLPDCISIPEWFTVEELLKFYEDFYRDFRPTKAIDMLNSLHVDRKSKLKALSKGNKEKVQLAAVMSREAQLYLLDEPMGGVDPATRDYILQTIISNYAEGSTVVISTHLIADVEAVLDEVVFLQQGEIALHDSVDHIRDEQNKSVDALFREVFKC